MRCIRCGSSTAFWTPKIVIRSKDGRAAEVDIINMHHCGDCMERVQIEAFINTPTLWQSICADAAKQFEGKAPLDPEAAIVWNEPKILMSRA